MERTPNSQDSKATLKDTTLTKSINCSKVFIFFINNIRSHLKITIGIQIMEPATLIGDFDACPGGCQKDDSSSKPVKSSKSALPDVEEFDSSSVVVEDVVNALKIAGGVIVRNFLGTEEIDRILKDVNPYLDADKPWDGKLSSSATLYGSLISDISS